MEPEIRAASIFRGRVSVIPQHVAIVMDGNGRWARKRGLPRLEGHRAGAERLREIVKCCPDHGIRFLTVFAFSTENWKRGRHEINRLTELFQAYIDSELEMLQDYGVRIRFIGSRRRLSHTLVARMAMLEEATADNRSLLLTVALNYGGRREIAHIVRQVAEAVRNGEVNVDQISEDLVSRYAYAPDLPDPDLIIRTSGELRLSNFLLWQAAYAELEFVDTLWPDFTVAEFTSVVERFARRSRRFGAL